LTQGSVSCIQSLRGHYKDLFVSGEARVFAYTVILGSQNERGKKSQCLSERATNF